MRCLTRNLLGILINLRSKDGFWRFGDGSGNGVEEMVNWWIGGLDDGFGEFWQVLVLVSWGCFCELNIFFINSVF